MTAPALAIEASGLVKTFGTTRAVDGIQMSVPQGGVYGLLGPNGAGKTTSIRIFATLTRPDAGRATVLGHDVAADPRSVRTLIGLTGQFATIDSSLTGMENMMLQGRLLGVPRGRARTRAAALLEAFGLLSVAGRAVKTYSGGMQRRLDVACAIVVPPKVLFLDEPTTGLDPQSRNQVWDIVRGLAGQGTTVLLTTQYLDEADQLSDRIAVLDRGKIIAEGTPGQLKASVGSGVLRVRLATGADRATAQQILARALGVMVHTEPDPVALTARIDGDTAADGAGGAVARALTQLAREGINVTTFALGQPSLDEVFLALTGQAADRNDRTEEVA